MQSATQQRVTRSSRIRRFLTIGLLLFLAATLFKAYCNVAFDYDTMRGQTESESIAEARGKGMLVCELDVQPAEMHIEGHTIRFTEAWLEERSLRTDFLVWFPDYKRVGGYNLCFTLQKRVDFSNGLGDWFFVEGDREASFGSNGIVYWQQLDTADLSTVRVSLVRSFKEPRPKNIRYIPRGE